MSNQTGITYAKFNIEVNKADLHYVQKRLGQMRDKAPVVIARAVNRTASNAKTMLAKQMKSVYSYKKSARSSMRIKKASAGDLTAIIRSSGRPHNLTSFKNGYRKPGAAEAEVINGVRKPIQAGKRKAWKRDGGIYIRKTDHDQAYVARGKVKSKHGYPIRFSNGPSTPKMLENKKVYGAKESEIKLKLYQHIDSRIAELVGGK